MGLVGSSIASGVEKRLVVVVAAATAAFLDPSTEEIDTRSVETHRVAALLDQWREMYAVHHSQGRSLRLGRHVGLRLWVGSRLVRSDQLVQAEQETEPAQRQALLHPSTHSAQQ